MSDSNCEMGEITNSGLETAISWVAEGFSLVEMTGMAPRANTLTRNVKRRSFFRTCRRQNSVLPFNQTSRLCEGSKVGVATMVLGVIHSLYMLSRLLKAATRRAGNKKWRLNRKVEWPRFQFSNFFPRILLCALILRSLPYFLHHEKCRGKACTRHVLGTVIPDHLTHAMELSREP